MSSRDWRWPGGCSRNLTKIEVGFWVRIKFLSWSGRPTTWWGWPTTHQRKILIVGWPWLILTEMGRSTLRIIRGSSLLVWRNAELKYMNVSDFVPYISYTLNIFKERLIYMLRVNVSFDGKCFEDRSFIKIWQGLIKMQNQSAKIRNSLFGASFPALLGTSFLPLLLLRHFLLLLIRITHLII